MKNNKKRCPEKAHKQACKTASEKYTIALEKYGKFHTITRYFQRELEKLSTLNNL